MARPFLLLTASLGLAALLACTTMGETKVASSLGPQDLATLDSLEADLVNLRLAPTPDGVDKLNRALDKVLGKTVYNKTYLGRLWGLRSELAWLRQDTGKMQDILKLLDQISPRESRRFVLQARLEADVTRRLEGLQTALDSESADEPAWLSLELGLNSVQAGQYARAAVAFDQAFALLGDGYRRLYGAQRDLAFTLKDQKVPTGLTPAWTLQKQLTLEALLGLTLQNSNFLAEFVPDKTAPLEPLAQTLVQKGWLPLGSTALASLVNRAGLADFLYRLAVYWKKSPQLLTAPLGYKASPIPDVPLEHPSLRAVIALVQWEVLDLPDGQNFLPADWPSALDLLQALERLKKKLRP